MDYQTKSKYCFLASYYFENGILERTLKDSLKEEDIVVLKELEDDYASLIIGLNEKMGNIKYQIDNSFNKDENAGKGNPNHDPKSGKFSTGGAYKDYTDKDYTIDEVVTTKKVVDKNSGLIYDLERYTHGDYDEYNKDLREGKDVDIKNSMDKLISNQSLNQNTKLFRGIKTNNEIKVGSIMKDAAYASTSFSENEAYRFTIDGEGENHKYGYLIRINAQKNQNGIAPSKYGVGLGSEKEYILPRNTKLEITRVGDVEPDGYTYVDAKIIDGQKNSISFVKDENAGKGNPYRDKDGKFGSGPSVKVSDSERDSIKLYNSSAYLMMNKLSRGENGLSLDSSGYKEDVNNIDNVISRNKLKKDVTLYRGIQRSTGDSLNLSPGKVITDKALMSTSLNKAIASKFGGGVGYIVSIKAKKGTSALDMNNVDGYDNVKYKDLEEFLLPRNTKLKINSIDTSGSEVIVNAEVVK